MSNNAGVRITFQGRSWAQDQPDELELTCHAFDLDYGALTVYPNEYDGINLTLAVDAPYTNEEGRFNESGGWRIEPDDALIDAFPTLKDHRGEVYGRVIVGSAEFDPMNTGTIHPAQVVAEVRGYLHNIRGDAPVSRILAILDRDGQPRATTEEETT